MSDNKDIVINVTFLLLIALDILMGALAIRYASLFYAAFFVIYVCLTILEYKINGFYVVDEEVKS